jgi:MFS family permease
MMVQAQRPGVSELVSEGERLERNRRRRKLLIIGTLAMVGGISGGIVGGHEADRLFDLAHPWSPTLCLAIASLFLLAVGIGKFALRGQVDEVERMAKLRATHVGASLFLIGYPIWFLLWKGGFVPEPQHVIIYAVLLVVMLLASLFYKFR